MQKENGIHIIDLVQTAQLLTQACEFVRKASESGKKFLFVGTKRQAAAVIAQEAERCGSLLCKPKMVRWYINELVYY